MSNILYLLIQCLSIISFLGIPTTSLAKIPSSQKNTIGSSDWIEIKLRQYPELSWLLENNSTSLAFNETLNSLIYLHSFLNGSRSAYLLIKQLNPKLVDYTFKDFLSMHKKIKNFSSSFHSEISQEEFIRIIETATVLKNIYYSKKAQRLFENYSISSNISHEEFYIKSLQVLNSFPELSPSFRRLTKKGQNLVTQARTLVNYKNIMSLSLNNTLNNITQNNKISSYNLNFDLLIFLIDLFGSGNYCLSTQNDFFALIKNIQQNLDPSTKNLIPIYQAQLQYEGKKYGEQPDSLEQISYIRLAKALNLNSPEEFMIFKQTFSYLDTEYQNHLIKYMSYPEDNPHLEGLCKLKESITFILNTEGHKDLLKKSLLKTLSIVAKSITYYNEQKNIKLLKFALKQICFSNINLDITSLDNLENLPVHINQNGDVFFEI